MTMTRDIPINNTTSNAIVSENSCGNTTINASPEKPRRNLTQAFEALCFDDHLIEITNEPLKLDQAEFLSPSYNSLSGVPLKENGCLISPTNVADFDIACGKGADDSDCLFEDVDHFPELNLHDDLRRELSEHCVRRVSCYCIIHDINKECTAMAQHDPLAASTTDKDSPLVIAALNGGSDVSVAYSVNDSSKVSNALIDEEQWMLFAIANRTPQETQSLSNNDCPSTFLQAMGEKEYENPVHAVTGHSRTQLWKPSRSWWEAKSGKNPWIEPASHNKRWRYLWPLIHYHKFLAKCIKKLKRNGVDVKLAISPVSVFLREEVCAVSDHLASVSLFDSDEWMACLHHFEGWTVISTVAEKKYRFFVRQLPLRSLTEPGDVDSPILRSQIDENFLRAMAAQREQMRDSNATVALTSGNQSAVKILSNDQVSTEAATGESFANAPSGQPPMYPRASPHVSGIPRQIHGVRRPRFFPQPGGWYSVDGQHYHDNCSVQSELSANSYPQQQQQRYDYHAGAPGMYPVGGPLQVPVGYYQPAPFQGSADHSQSSDSYGYSHTGYADGWIHPYMAATYAMHQQQGAEGFYCHPMHMSPSVPSPATVYEQSQPTGVPEDDAVDPSAFDMNQIDLSGSLVTPFKFDSDSSFIQSPYWSHLDQATISMGLPTPAKPEGPMTPIRGDDCRLEGLTNDTTIYGGEQSSFASKAQAPLLRQHYYSVGNYSLNSSGLGTNGEYYVPPSPATQFMMSPHAHSNSGYAYNYGYGFSPRRPPRNMSTPRNVANKTIPEKGTRSSPLNTTPQEASRAKIDHNNYRHSPATVETVTDSESDHKTVST